MKPTQWFSGIWPGVLLFSPLLAGCSLIGLSVDASREPDTLAVRTADRAIEGRNVLITLRDGYCFAGECRRVGTLPAELYRSRYAQWRKASDNAPLPFSPGDTLTVAWGGGETAIGQLEGFDRSSLVMSIIPKPPLLRLRRPRILSIPVEKVDTVKTRAGHTVNGQFLRARSQEGIIPTRDGMLIRRADTLAWLPLDDVAEIKEIRFSYDWLHKGAIADAIGLAAAVVYFATRK